MNKRVFIAFAAMVFGVFSMMAGHLNFKGIAIDGSIDEFANALVAKGFTLADSEHDDSRTTRVFKMSEDGLDAIIKVVATPTSHTVRRVDIVIMTGETYEAEKRELINSFGEMVESKYKVDEKKTNGPAEVTYTVENGDGSISIKINDQDVEICFLDTANLYLNMYEKQVANNKTGSTNPGK